MAGWWHVLAGGPCCGPGPAAVVYREWCGERGAREWSGAAVRSGWGAPRWPERRQDLFTGLCHVWQGANARARRLLPAEQGAAPSVGVISRSNAVGASGARDGSAAAAGKLLATSGCVGWRAPAAGWQAEGAFWAWHGSHCSGVAGEAAAAVDSGADSAAELPGRSSAAASPSSAGWLLLTESAGCGSAGAGAAADAELLLAAAFEAWLCGCCCLLGMPCWLCCWCPDAGGDGPAVHGQQCTKHVKLGGACARWVQGRLHAICAGSCCSGQLYKAHPAAHPGPGSTRTAPPPALPWDMG